ncbi:leucine--tRNA ligase [Flavobacterium cheongpyeongense]|uniref:Leucine--tRNA ligase n=1 Tax=Flavobacterium cheongpyeongense TaxID=2212651 RepID=A0A2V4BMG3_9FLAO|nr:class I tRNA ligase family protein [Flavobacterium cheongpyeongense]PXY40186.1 leucine--tRNA ligase [Flavobacterium cheongpyeongense]
MKYNPNEIDAKWQKYWAENQTFAAKNNSERPKHYVLDMFPYPSGAGLHVGHPLGYIASDVYSRFKRHQGFNVLHPMGYDSFGLPAEQYAIQTGQRPEDTTRVNIDGGVDKEGKQIAGYRKQLDKIGFSFDWAREVRTSNPDYYKHTQWIFIQLFNSWYNKDSDKAEDISTLISIFEKEGNTNVNAVSDDNIIAFSSSEWNSFSKDEQEKILLQYRLTYLAETEVNWCPGLGTVLANDEIVNGVSERGGYPVIRKKMTQWSMRISAYAERLLQGLNDIDWSESIKESQRNWIGKSVGAMVKFKVLSPESLVQSEDLGLGTKDSFIEVFTTRPDTIFGVTFMTLAPEHDLVAKITTPEQKDAVEAYIEKTAKRSERERMADVKTISGVFTGAYAEHPFTKEAIPVWIGDYVLAGYGTGAVMAVPCGDERDYAFANFFKGQNGMQEIKNIFANVDISESAYGSKDNVEIANSDFLNGLNYKDATQKVIAELEKIEQGTGKTNYRLRDAVFSRQRYWGEPFPVYYVNGLPKMIDAQHLPIILPEVEKYLPTEDGLPPLGNAAVWAWDTNQNKVVNTDLVDNVSIFPLELNTMPGWAGSSWYWMRYMDAHNETEFASKEALAYWESVDLYIGGSEHATGHLLYSRFWNKFLKDKGFAPTEEPFKKLINQGMILGTSAYVYRRNDTNEFYSFNTILSPKDKPFIDPKFVRGIKVLDEISSNDKSVLDDINIETVLAAHGASNSAFPIHVDVNFVNSSDELDIEKFKAWREDYADAKFIDVNGKFIVGREVEKMSKSKYNVVTPDDICAEYGADTLRLYEMFLGPLEQAKPWNTAGISGVFGFLKKLWRLYFDDNGLIVNNDEPTKDNLKSLHKTIKKVAEDIESFSFNTSVSQFMICVNELSSQNCHSRAILEPLAIVISPYAPHIAEELWSQLGHTTSISEVAFPIFEEKHLVESEKEYPVSFNGKMRFTIKLPLDLTAAQIEEIIMKDERTQKQLEGRTPNKVIIVPGKIINLVG